MATDVATIEVATLRTWLEQWRPVQLLDVRPQADRDEWAIPGSQHIDAYDALHAGDPRALAGVTLDADVPVVTVCGEGKTSLTAARQLQERGLQALSLAGGMRAWSLAWNTAEVEVAGSMARVIQVRRTGKGCLSYLIGVGDEAVVIDPSVDTEVYQRLARRYGWRITHVLETHLHADHLSRAYQLAQASGAALELPRAHRVAVPFSAFHDGDTVAVGGARLTILHTPGHTPESSCYLLNDAALLTGDTLFLAAVGRPDLHSNREGARDSAHALYRSLQRLMQLDALLPVLPGHTSEPIAFDSRPLVARLQDIQATLPLLAEPEDAFVETVLARLPPTPPNHARIVALNEAAMPADDPTELEAGANRCAVA